MSLFSWVLMTRTFDPQSREEDPHLEPTEAPPSSLLKLIKVMSLESEEVTSSYRRASFHQTSVCWSEGLIVAHVFL